MGSGWDLAFRGSTGGALTSIISHMLVSNKSWNPQKSKGKQRFGLIPEALKGELQRLASRLEPFEVHFPKESLAVFETWNQSLLLCLGWQ